MIITRDNEEDEIYDILFREPNSLVSCVGSGGFSEVYLLRDQRHVAKVSCLTSEASFSPSNSPFLILENIVVEDPDAALEDLILNVDGSQFRLQDPIRLGMAIVERGVLWYIHDKVQNGQTVQKHVVKPVASYFVTQGGDIYHILVEEYIRGNQADLHRYDLPQAFFSIYAISRVLDYFGRMGVIYRDLKPRNIIQEGGLENNLGNPRLIDFGLALIIQDRINCCDEVTRWALRTQEDYKKRKGSCLGTAAYIAPEQSRNDPLTPNLDLFALGVTAFEILTGERLTEDGLSALEVYNIASSQTYLYRAEAISRLHVKGYSGAVIESVEKLLATDPLERSLDPLRITLENTLCEMGYDTNGRLNLSLD